jgi:putative peptidoglycan lipid II flippase
LADVTPRRGGRDEDPADALPTAAGRADLRRPGLFARIEGILRTALPRGALILSSVTFVAFGMGWLETKVVSHVYGAGTESDAFWFAFLLPATVLEILVSGGLFACFVPLYVELKDEDARDAEAFGRTIFTLAVMAMTVAVAIMVVFAPECVSIFAPGFSGQQRSDAIQLFRILGVTQIIMAATLVLGEVLIAEKRWLVYAIAQIFYSAGIILGSLLLGDVLGVYGAAVGAIGGALGFLGVRLFGAIRAGFVPLPRLNLRTKGLRRYFWLMLPKMVSQPLEGSIIFLYFAALASTLQTGSITDLNYARKFQTMPELVIGAQFAIAAFPALSAAADMGNRRDFRRIFSTNLATIAVLSTCAALGLIVLGGLAVQILLGGGAFTADDVRTTTMLVAIFAVSIPLESMIELVARGIYATRNTIIPTLASVAGFVSLFVVSQALAPRAGLMAIPASYAVGMGVKLVIVAVALVPRMERIGRPAEQPSARRDMARRVGRAAVPASRSAGWTAQPDWEPGVTAASLVAPDPHRLRKQAVAVGLIVVFACAGMFTAFQALKGASFGYAPVVTPWARVRPTAELATPTLAPTAGPSAIGTPSGSSSPTTGPSPTAAPSATPAGIAPGFNSDGQFVMDLYQPGDFVGEYVNTHCVPAAMQTMMNIMDAGADTTRETQDKLFALGNSIAEGRNGTPDPEGWAQGLQQLGYGNYRVAVQNRMETALKVVVKQVRLTNRPAGLLVWYGWHSWVVSGFVATDDPAVTDNFTVLSLYIEDVWYNRHSTLWNKTRDGYSRPPDSLVPMGEMSQDYKAWDQAVVYAAYQKRWVYIEPIQ